MMCKSCLESSRRDHRGPLSFVVAPLAVASSMVPPNIPCELVEAACGAQTRSDRY